MPTSISGLPTNLSGTERDAARPLAPDVTLTSDADFGSAGAFLVIRGLATGDQIRITNQGVGPGQIGVSGSVLTWGGVSIGTIALNSGGTFSVSFNSATTREAVEALIEALTYENISLDPMSRHELFLDVVVDGQSVLAGDDPTYGYIQRTIYTGTPIDTGVFSTPGLTKLDPASTSNLFAVGGGAVNPSLFTANPGGYSYGSHQVVQGTSGSAYNFSTGDTRQGYSSGALLDGGYNEFVVGGASGRVAFWQWNGSAFAQVLGTFDVGENALPILADLDGDGDLDLTVGAADGQLHYFENTGTATAAVFEARAGAASPVSGISVAAHSAPAFFDGDGDGDLDLVVGALDGTLSYFENTGTAQAAVYEARTGADNPFDGVDVGTNSAPMALDLSGDGRAELVVGDAYGRLTMFEATNPRGVRIEVDIAEINTAPTRSGANLGQTVREGESGTLQNRITYIDNESPDDAVIYTVTSLTNGAPARSGVLLGIGDSFSQEDVTLGLVTFVHDGGETTTASFGFSISDEDGGVLAGQTFNVTVTSANDRPTLTGAGPVTFGENAVNDAPQLFATGITVGDAEGNLNGGRVTITGLLAEDVVTVRGVGDGAGEIGVSGSTIRYGGVVIGVMSGGQGDAFTVTLNASATSAALQALVHSLAYGNTSDEPTATRDLVIDIRDATGANLRGDYSFAAPEAMSLGSLPINASPELVDLDGDGDLDMLMGGGDGLVTYYRNTGTATAPVFELEAAPEGLAGVDFGSFAEVAAADLNHDGLVDLMVSVAGTTNLFMNVGEAGAPAFELYNQFVNGATGRAALSLGDLDGDGDLDIVQGTSSANLRYYRNVGTAEAPNFQFVPAGSPVAFTSGTPVTHPLLIDLDHDGDLDILMGGQSGTVVFRENIGTATAPAFGAAETNFFGSTSLGTIGRLTSGDIDGDGDEDVIVAVNNTTNTNFFVVENTSPGLPRVTINVTAEDEPPSASDDIMITTESQPLTTGNVLANDHLPGTVAAVNGVAAAVGQPIVLASGALLTLNADGSFAYDPNDVFNYLRAENMGAIWAQDTFTYTTSTGHTATVRMVVYGEDSDGDVIDGAERGDFPSMQDGGIGIDTIDYTRTPGAVIVRLDQERALNDGYGNIDILRNLENATGSAFNDTIVGNAVANVLIGGAGDDIVDGSAGDDVLVGGEGLDSLTGGDGIDTAAYGAEASGVDASLARGDARRGGTAIDLFIGVENLTGSAFADVLTGDATANVLTGGAGNDVLEGGGGLDALIGGDGVDTASYAGASAGVDASLGRGDARQGGVIVDTFVGIENLIGSDFNDVLIGDGGANVLTGGLGADTLLGFDGDDRLIGGTGAANTLQGGLGDDVYMVEANDSVYELAGQGRDRVETTRLNYTLGANVEDLTYTGTGVFTGRGNGLANVLTGGVGNDSLYGAGGIDTLVGGDGIDTVDYYTAAGGVTASLAAGGASNDGDGASDVFTGIENLNGSNHNDALTGDAGANALTGGLGDDVLVGGAGNDQLFGGVGLDTVDYSGAASGVTVRVNLNTAQDGDGGTDLLNAVENVTGSAFSDLLVGNALNNVLRGGLGADTLIGLAGNDVLYGGTGAANTLQGGAGDDQYYVDAAGDTVVELNGEGYDTLNITISSFTIPMNVEQVIFTGAGSFTAIGNSQANYIYGGTARDTLVGGGGNDILSGGAGAANVLQGGTGDDDYYVRAVGDSVYELAGEGVNDRVLTELTTYRLSANVEHLSFMGGLDAIAFHGTGNDLGNTIFGAQGDDVLTGLAGDDLLYGGNGQTVDWFGNPLFDGVDLLLGGEGNDRMVNFQGADRMEGGVGDDTYDIRHAAAVIVERAGEGTDTVRTYLASHTLGADLENLSFLSESGGGAQTGVTGVGNALNNVITGGEGDDFLTGGQGDDTLNGASGTDTVHMSGLRGDYTLDTSTTSAGVFHITDTVAGRDGADTLTYVERIVFSDGEVYVVPAPTAPPVPGPGAGLPGWPGWPGFPGMPGGMGAAVGGAKDAGPQVLPGAGDADFLPLKTHDDAQVLPALDEGGLARAAAPNPDWMATLVLEPANADLPSSHVPGTGGHDWHF